VGRLGCTGQWCYHRWCSLHGRLSVLSERGLAHPATARATFPTKINQKRAKFLLQTWCYSPYDVSITRNQKQTEKRVGDALNYEVMTKIANKASLLLWLAAESSAPCDCDDSGEVLRFRFADLDDAFRFRMRFDEVVLAA
jgi:hypothetical protein